MARGKINDIKLIQLGSRQMQNVSPKAILSIKLRSKPISMKVIVKSPKPGMAQPTFEIFLRQMKIGLMKSSTEARLYRVGHLHSQIPLTQWKIFSVIGIVLTSRGTGDVKNVGPGTSVAVETVKCAG